MFVLQKAQKETSKQTNHAMLSRVDVKVEDVLKYLYANAGVRTTETWVVRADGTSLFAPKVSLKKHAGFMPGKFRTRGDVGTTCLEGKLSPVRVST